MPAERVFLDSNIVLHLLSADEDKARSAEAAISVGAIISVQVLNEVSNVMLKKLKLSWGEVSDFLDLIKSKKGNLNILHQAPSQKRNLMVMMNTMKSSSASIKIV